MQSKQKFYNPLIGL